MNKQVPSTVTNKLLICSLKLLNKVNLEMIC